MPCQISKKENSPDAIRLVRAFRQGHRVAKGVGKKQLALSLSAIVLGVAADRWAPNMKAWIALYGIAVALFDTAFLEANGKKAQESAALIQEEFDSLVLELPWSKKSRPDPETVLELAAEYEKSSSKKDTPIADWYPIIVDALPIERARLICQRTNMWWDASLRHNVWPYYLAGLIALALGATAWGLAKDLHADALVVVFASLVPAALQLLRKLRAHKEAASESDRAKEHIDQVWARMRRGEMTDSSLGREAVPLQEEVYQRRRTAPEIPEWLYNRKWKKYEERMKAAAKKMVSEALEAASSSPAPNTPVDPR